MILDKLVEKKDIFIYIDHRIIRLRDNVLEINRNLRNPDVNNKRKKILFRGKIQVIGRIKELTTLKGVLSEGKLKKKAKEYWDNNYRSGLMVNDNE